ncbi:MAG: hypothetical protein OEM82_11000, partial [Acidobacteriota bacterium]|nr:hypothetical protein [Acidobacteriota bacterium]
DPRAPRPSLARDIFGGRIGGPIIKDRLFFFYSYEGQRQTLGEPVTRTVPLAHLGRGELRFAGTGPSCTGGNCALPLAELNAIYNVVGINPAAVAALASAASRYPANSTSAGDQVNTSGFRWNAPTTIKENTHIARFDLKINDSQDLFGRFNYQWDNQAGGAGLQAFPDTPAGGVWSHPHGYVVGHNWTINSNMINNFRYGVTRQSFSVQGDSSENFTNFRFVFTPFLYNRTLNRTTPVTNITDDFTWIRGNQTLQFGGNVRLIRNRRTDFGSAFDVATANPSFYNLSGAVVTNEIANNGYAIADIASAQAGATALIGRFSQYSGNFTFDLDGSVLAAGTPSNRNFATEEYEAYVQDIWKPFRNLTITAGLRYSLSRPVYEQNGFQVVPSVPLGDLFDRRVAGMAQGVPVNELVTFVKGGPKNNGPGFYPMDKNNLQPRIAAAWSPAFSGGFWKALFGEEGDSTIRGGFAITNDYFGSQLAVSFDGLSAIGFTSSVGINANTYNVTTNPAPLFTAFGQDVRSLPGIPPPTQVFSAPADEQTRIQTSLDANIISPIHYTWNVSYGRSLPKGAYFEMNYIGRKAENLFASRDIFALNNLVDPQSGMDWYTAAGLLVDARNAGVATSAIGNIPYFENLFPNAGAALSVFGLGPGNTEAIYGLINDFGILDYTFVQLIIDDATEFGLPVNPGLYPNMFFHPQYAALTSFGTTAHSLYHGGNFSLRQRLGDTLTYDINYTYSKSMDNASGLQTGGSYGSQFILNPLRPEDNYSVSDFDTKHVVNANFIFQLPIGRGKAFFSDMNAFADAIIGGWQLAGVYRWNSGQPVFSPFDGQVWATNWNVQSSGVRIRPVETTENRNNRNIFANPLAALNSYRNARPGETGDRNVLRGVAYQNFDLGLSKYFTMPWSETHKLQFRWEVFNVMNTQPFSAGAFTRASWGLGEDPNLATVANDFGNVYNAIQGSPRSMQFGLRYEF